ncbi:10750_t:CDS:2, partial [Dentiscutata erythropus]
IMMNERVGCKYSKSVEGSNSSYLKSAKSSNSLYLKSTEDCNSYEQSNFSNKDDNSYGQSNFSTEDSNSYRQSNFGLYWKSGKEDTSNRPNNRELYYDRKIWPAQKSFWPAQQSFWPVQQSFWPAQQSFLASHSFQDLYFPYNKQCSTQVSYQFYNQNITSLSSDTPINGFIEPSYDYQVIQNQLRPQLM